MTETVHRLFRIQFGSYSDMKQCLDDFIKVILKILIYYIIINKESGFSYRVGRSIKRTNEAMMFEDDKLIYRYIKYICPHGDDYLSIKNTSAPHSTLSKGCPAYITVFVKNEALYVLNYDINHNHQKYDIRIYQHNQSVCNGLKRTLSLCFNWGADNRRVKESLESDLSIPFSLKKIRNMKYCSKRNNQQTFSMDDLLTKYGDQLLLEISKESETNELNVLCFTTKNMQNLYACYGEVLHIDATYKVNKTMYPFYHFVIVDSNGQTQPIFFAFVRNETQDLVDIVVSTFFKLMKEIKITQIIFVDKDSTEINSIKKFLRDAKVLLCSFHVEKAMERKINTLGISKNLKDTLKSLSKKTIYTKSYKKFQYLLEEIKKTNITYFSYLSKCWLGISNMWAQSLRKGLLTFGSNTNNRVEQAHGKLKSFLSRSSSFPVQIDEILRYVSILESEFDIKEKQFNTKSSKISEDPMLNKLLSYFTPYSRKKIIENYKPDEFITMWKLKSYYFFYQISNSAMITEKNGSLLCDYNFFIQYKLPCTHLIYFLKLNIVQINSLINPRWTLKSLPMEISSDFTSKQGDDISKITSTDTIKNIEELNESTFNNSISSSDEIERVEKNSFKKNKELADKLLHTLNALGGNEYSSLFSEITSSLKKYEKSQIHYYINANHDVEELSHFVVNEVKTKGRPKEKKNYIKYKK